MFCAKKSYPKPAIMDCLQSTFVGLRSTKSHLAEMVAIDID